MNKKDRDWLASLKAGDDVMSGLGDVFWLVKVVRTTNCFIFVKRTNSNEIDKHRKSDGMKAGGIRYLRKLPDQAK